MIKLKILKLLNSFNLIEEKKFDEKQQIELIKTSPLFNQKWYLSQNPDVKAKKIGAAKHYVKYGWKEGRNPSLEFNTIEYIKKYPEILQSKLNPIIHYIQNNKCPEGKGCQFYRGKSFAESQSAGSDSGAAVYLCLSTGR